MRRNYRDKAISVRHLLDNWREVVTRVRAADLIAIFLDFDGTLARFQSRPADVHLNGATRRAIERLAGNPRTRVTMISGRRLADLRARVSVPDIGYLGLHGWENGLRLGLRPETQSSVDRAKQALASSLRGLPNIRIEDKGPVFSVHYRDATDGEVHEARSAVYASVSSLSALRMIQGRKVWEIMPWAIGDKGTAVRRQMNRLGRRVLPIYVGDDETDELAFAALSQGITVRVGPGSLTRSKYQLRNPDEVRGFLERLAGLRL
jgi:trehalose-phosphatase